jgi:putative sterol carrier protein
MADPSIQQIIAGMPSRFNPKAAPNIDVVLQFKLSGKQGDEFFADIKNNTCELHKGVHENPTLVLKMSDQTYVDMVMGRITGQEAFFKRKLQYQGPIALAVKLNRFFNPPEAN